MTEEKKGVSAWLRGLVDECGVSGTRSCLDIAEVFDIDCKHEKTCRDCIAKMMTAIADRIDAERALPDGMEWPRFEDGEPVKMDDKIEFEGKTMRVYLAAFNTNRWTLWCEHDGIDGKLIGLYGERLKRPAPELLDADGVSINVGDTVYCDGEDEALTVTSISGVGGEYCCVTVKNADSSHCTVDALRLTHELPDSWRLWGDDLDMAVKVGEVDKVEMMRRAKALAKAGEVE